jgi:hypothetical protein
MRRALAWIAPPVAATALLAGCHSHGPGSHAHGPDGAEVAWSEGVREDSRPPKAVPAAGGRLTEWWGCYDGTQNVGTRRITARPLKTGGHELVVETDWFDGNVNNMVRVRGGSPVTADELLVKTYSDGLVKRDLACEREAPGGTVMVLRDRHNGDVRRIVVPGNALTLWQIPNYIESPAFGGAETATLTLLDTEGLIATWTLQRAGTARLQLHGSRREAVVVEGRGEKVDGHAHARYYVVDGRVELVALGDTPVYLLRASRAGARQDLQEPPLTR